MGVITYTRCAKCKDCDNLKYFYIGRLKRHKCSYFNKNRCLNDSPKSECFSNNIFKLNSSYYPGRLE